MKLVDSSVIFEPVEFIFNLLNVVVTKHFFVFSYETVKFIPNTLYMCVCVLATPCNSFFTTSAKDISSITCDV